jgi:DNA-binding transcriptional MerR regulator/quercetin dioxygenase-like cupin family protein
MTLWQPYVRFSRDCQELSSLWVDLNFRFSNHSTESQTRAAGFLQILFKFLQKLWEYLDRAQKVGKNNGDLGALMKRPSLFYKISHISKILGVSPSTLRVWEQLGLLRPARSQGRYRLYTSDDLITAKHILHLLKNKKLNLAGVVHLLSTQKFAIPNRPRVPTDATVDVGGHLLDLRRKEALTLAQVARQAGVSISFLSAIERGRSKPSIATLQRLAVIYKTSVLSMFGAEKENKTHRLVRPSDRKVLKPEPGVQMELLVLGKSQMEPHIFRIAPGVSSGGSYHHEGEEFVHVLKGSLEVWLDEVERYTLTPGDTLHFESTHAHRWKSLSEGETILLWVNTPPTF